MYSDNGTNLVGANRELKTAIVQWNQQKIHGHLLLNGIDWKFNPPSASHFGGVWERMIRSVRRVLYGLMKKQCVQMDDEAMSTLLCEVENIVNCRPITKLNDDPDDIEALTPNHLLLLRQGSELPCGLFSKDDSYARRRWKQVQYLADIFWSRWSKEYLTALQERQKWFRPRRNVMVDDIVLIMDSTPRNSWCLGKVVAVQPDRKGLVRVAEIKTKTSILLRPVHKLCVLLEAE
jgi:hypothetical protein